MKINLCKTCGAKIVWAETPNGRIPLNATRVRAYLYDKEDGTAVPVGLPGRPTLFYVSHLVRCPDAASHGEGRGS